MSSKNKTTKRLPKQLIFSFLGMGSLLVLFTNMGANPEFLIQFEAPPVKVESKIDNVLNLIDDTDDYLAKEKVSHKAMRLHKSHKKYLINKVAHIKRAENCDELIDLVPSVESGTYLLFTEKGDKPSLVGCEFKNSNLIDEVIVARPKEQKVLKVAKEIIKCPLSQKPRCGKGEKIVENLLSNGCKSFSCKKPIFVCPKSNKPKCGFMQKEVESKDAKGCRGYTCQRISFFEWFKPRTTER